MQLDMNINMRCGAVFPLDRESSVSALSDKKSQGPTSGPLSKTEAITAPR
jgi:hypothetical protein